MVIKMSDSETELASIVGCSRPLYSEETKGQVKEELEREPIISRPKVWTDSWINFVALDHW